MAFEPASPYSAILPQPIVTNALGQLPSVVDGPHAEPFDLPKADPATGLFDSPLGRLPGLSPIVQQQASKEGQASVLAEELSREEVLRIQTRLERIRTSVPGIDPTLAMSVAQSQAPPDQMVKLAQSRHEAKPKSLWSKIGKGILAPFKAAFVDAPEWIWKKTVVDLMQEVAEFAGVDSTVAQKLSPGQTLIAMMPGDWGTEDNGQVVMPDKWEGGARWASGALDMALRLTADPTLVMGKFRTLRALPFKAEKLFGVTRGTSFERMTGAKLTRLTKGQQNLRSFMVGDLKLGAVAQSLWGHNAVQKAFREIYDLGHYSDGAARIATRFSRVWGGVDARMATLLHTSAQEAVKRGDPEYLRNTWIAMFTGQVPRELAEEVEKKAGRFAELHMERVEAFRTAAELQGQKITESGFARGLEPFGEHFLGEVPASGLTKLGGQAELLSIESGIPIDQLAREAKQGQEFGRILGPADKPFLSRGHQLRSEEGAVARQLRDMEPLIPDLERGKYMIPEMRDTLRFTAATRMGRNIPAASLSRDTLKWMKQHKIGEIFEYPVLRNIRLEMQPWSSVEVHDPMRWQQYWRLGRQFGLPDNETLRYTQQAIDVKDERALGRITREFVRKGYKHLGLNDEEIDAIEKAARSRRKDLYGIADDVVKHRLYSSQADNIIDLADPRVIRAMQRRVSRWMEDNPQRTSAQTAKFFTGLVDAINKTFKRVAIATPKTGFRITPEEQMRPAMLGLKSAITNPLVMMGIATGFISPKLARKVAHAGEPANIRDIAVDMRDIGTTNMAYDLGYLTEAERNGLQRHKFSGMKKDVDQIAYRKTQARAINDFVMNDALARQHVLYGKDAARRWAHLPNDPDAAAWRADMANEIEEAGGLDNFLELQAKDMRRLRAVHPRVKQKLTHLGDVSDDDLIGLEAPELLAGEVDDLATAPWGKIGDQLLNHLTERFLTAPSSIGRSHVMRAELRADVERRIAAARRAGKDVDRDVIEARLRGATIDASKNPFEHDLVERSYQEVGQLVRGLLFDFREHSRLADTLRWVFPFGHAYQEMVTTWGKLMSERPWMPHILSAAWDSAAEIPGLTYTDPNTDEKMFVVPFTGWAMRFAGLKQMNPLTGLPTGSGIPLIGRVDGINLVSGSGGMPGFGPFLQIPASWVTDHMPVPEEVVNTIFPFGQSAWYDNFLPAWLRRLRQTISGEGDRVFANQAKEVLGYEIFHTLKAGKSISDIDTDRAVSATRWLFAARMMASVLSPTGVFGGAAPEDDPDMPLKQVIDFYRFAGRADPALADRMVLEQWGPEIFAALTAKSKVIKRGRQPTSIEAEQLIGVPGFKQGVDRYGEAWWDLFKEVTDGKFDYREYLRQLGSGERVPFALDEYKNQAIANVGWQRWFMFRNTLDKMMLEEGLATYEVKGAEPYKLVRDAFEERLSLSLPEWAADRSTGGEIRMRDTNIVRLAEMSSLPELNTLDSVEGLREYFRLRQQVIGMMQAAQLGSLNSQSALRVKLLVNAMVRDIVKRHPAFARIWSRFLSRDTFRPLEELAIETGALGRGLEEVAA